MDRAAFDDSLTELIEKTIVHYIALLDKSDKEKRITSTQLAALSVHVESHGYKGLTDVVKLQRDKNRKNLTAFKDDKGPKPPQNPSFWDTMHETLEHGLKDLCEQYGDTNLTCSLFAQRIEAKLNYRTIREK